MLLRIILLVGAEISCSAACYQLHGFPPSCGRGRGRGSSPFGESSSYIQRSVHNVGAQSNSDIPNNIQPNMLLPASPAPNILSADQCQQLICFLQSQIQGQAISSEHVPTNSSSGSW